MLLKFSLVGYARTVGQKGQAGRVFEQTLTSIPSEKELRSMSEAFLSSKFPDGKIPVSLDLTVEKVEEAKPETVSSLEALLAQNEAVRKAQEAEAAKRKLAEAEREVVDSAILAKGAERTANRLKSMQSGS